MEISEQLKQTNYKYPSLAHSSKINYKKTIEDVLIDLSINVTEDKFSVQFQSIFKSFVKINTKDYLKLLKYTKSESLSV